SHQSFTSQGNRRQNLELAPRAVSTVNVLDWLIEHWLIARWVIFAVVAGSVWGILTTILADDSSSRTFASDGWISLCCGLGVGLLIVPLWGIRPNEEPLSRNLTSFMVIILMTVSLTLGIETTEGSMEDAGFWFAMFAVCAVAFRTLTSPMKAIAVLIHPPLGEDDHP
ncbi:MAG: hypothetical protein ACPGKR_06165, partial [Poseidonia sp.]